MKKDLFVRVSLVVIALLLVLNLGGIVFSTTPTFAAKKYEYKAVGTDGQSESGVVSDAQNKLEQYSNTGWELIAVTDHILYFKK
jgi:hypothetical protein